MTRRLADGPTSARPSGDWWPPPLLKAPRKPALPWRSSIAFIAIRFTPSSAAAATAARTRRTSRRISSSTLLEKGTLGRADPQRGRFRSFLLGALDHFLAHAAERARAGKRGGGCQWVFLDDDAAEDRYQLAAPEGMTAEKIFDARWAAALVEATFTRLRGELESEGKGHLFEALQGFLLGREDASYQQVADALSLSLGALKTVIHRLRGRYRALLREEVARTVATPAEVDEELRYLRAALRG